MAKSLKDILTLMESQTERTGGDYYSKAGDCLFIHMRRGEYYRDRVDDVLTVFRSFDTNEVVGCQVKGLSALFDHLGSFGVNFDDGSVSLSLVFMVSNLVAEEPSYEPTERRQIYSELARRGRGQSVRVPVTAGAFSCSWFPIAVNLARRERFGGDHF